MEPYANTGRAAARRGPRVNALGALVSPCAGAVPLRAFDGLRRGRARYGSGQLPAGGGRGAGADRRLYRGRTRSVSRRRRSATSPAGGPRGFPPSPSDGQAAPVPAAFAEHMAQVQRWVKAFRYRAAADDRDVSSLLVFLTLIGAAALKTRTFAPRSYLLGAAIPVLLAGGAFLWAALDFASFWDVLHQRADPRRHLRRGRSRDAAVPAHAVCRGIPRPSPSRSCTAWCSWLLRARDSGDSGQAGAQAARRARAGSPLPTDGVPINDEPVPHSSAGNQL